MAEFSLDSAVLLSATEAIMRHVDDATEKPVPLEGENVMDYWVRVVQFQAWEKGYGTCRDDASHDAEFDIRTFNPYDKFHEGS